MSEATRCPECDGVLLLSTNTEGDPPVATCIACHAEYEAEPSTLHEVWPYGSWELTRIEEDAA